MKLVKISTNAVRDETFKVKLHRVQILVEIRHTHVEVVGFLGSLSNLASFRGLCIYITSLHLKPVDE